MSFEFKRDETVEHGARRIARNEIGDAIADLSKGPGRGHRGPGSSKAVHETRKRLKRLRALVRLVRGAIGARAHHRENRAFRDAGRALSAARDAAVLVDAFDGLLEHFREHVSARSFAAARRLLVARRRQAMREHGRGGGQAQVLAALRSAKRHVSKWKLKKKEFAALQPGLKRVYQQGHDALAAARRHPDFQKLHELRKRVKDLWHVTQLIEPAWPEALRQLGDELHELSDQLGDDHDLAVLRETIAAAAEDFGSPQDVEALLGLIDARRRELQEAALRLAERLYADRPKAFVERFARYWKAWKQAIEPSGGNRPGLQNCARTSPNSTTYR